MAMTPEQPSPEVPPPGDTVAVGSLVGRRIGNFEITALIGRGGMGEVYRAYDTRLRRNVAVKVLPEALTADASRLASLEREARVVASLNHPHIATIHGVEESNGLRALVLELVEGETLSDRLTHLAAFSGRGLPLPEVLHLARQIADALDAAHEKGITHRDLKPANIKITPDGVVKLLDFGIAKVVRDSSEIDFTQAPTVTAEAAGLVVGTAGYMSPEQARGKPVDKRTDIWAFGCVLFQMLSGRMAFSGETLSDTIAAILSRDPDWSILPAETPTALRRLVQRCLDRDPKQRLRDIGDARLELEQVIRAPHDDAASDAVNQAQTWRRRAVLAGAAAVIVASTAVGLFWVGFPRAIASPDEGRVARFIIDLPEKDKIVGMVPTFNSNVALSPDGRLLALTPLPGPVYIHRLDSLKTEPLEVTKSPNFRGAPLFSPDGTSIAFIEGNAIYSNRRPFLKAALSGGAATTLTEYDNFHGGDWAPDGWIYWTATYPGGIVRIRDSGGPIEAVTNLDLEKGERSHRFAQLLPGGEALIYTVAFAGIDSYDDARIDLWDLKTRQRKTLIAGGTSAMYSPSGHLVYARAGKLFAVRFDPRRREITGSPFEVIGDVMMSRNTGAAHFALSKRGDLAYAPGGVEGDSRTLVWVDRSGKTETLPLDPASYLYPRIAPDGRSMAVEIEGPNHDFYFYDFTRTVLSKVTADGLSHNPVWSPDGTRLAYRSWRAGGMTIWLMNADRSGSPERFDPQGTRQSPVSFSPDGKFLAFDQKDGQTDDDALILPIGGGAPARPIARTKASEGGAKFSPDGRWVAYSSSESGRPEIYVQPFPGLGPKIQISNAGGTDPVWRRSGGELYYRAGSKMMAVAVNTAGPSLRASAPKMLFEGPYYEGTGASCEMGGSSSSNYDVTADGQRFLMVRDTTDSIATTRIIVVLNWAEEIRARERVILQTGRPASK